MSLIDILYTILIGPLQLLFEVIYMMANRLIGHPGVAIIVLSLIMNILVLPLYKRSDDMQEEARKNEERLSKGVKHIKKTFKGNERMMILQTYYKQNNYKPTDSLNGSVSLLLEIPFFMAAYNFLSNLDVIQGVSFGPIVDMGAPDALLTIGGVTINVLPILMTFVNIVSSSIYLKGTPLKDRVQLYGIALIFLVFLYNSPAGLVFYWTLNNVFSLFKNIFYMFKKAEKPKQKVEVSVSALGKNDKKTFILCAVFLTVLVGVLIPSTIIAASPQEFIDITYYHNPMWYLANTLCLSVGTFIVWFSVFYWIASEKGKVIFDKIIWILCGVFIINYMFFGKDLGVISARLQYENGLVFTRKEELLNILVILVAGFVLYIISCKFKKSLVMILLTAVIALIGMSSVNVMKIQETVDDTKEIIASVEDSVPNFNLSKNGKNVIVFMLDRGMSEYIPYIFNEKPELKEQFDGFTFYSNTISHGGFTIFGTPGLFGGYEYTPVEMNKRENEFLVEKQNEALKVMPVLFSNNDFEVTVCDPPYANYQWIPDISIYNEYPEIDAYVTEGQFGDPKSSEFEVQSTKRNFFCFSIMKIMPLMIQDVIYDNGLYNQSESKPEELVYSSQAIYGITKAEGISGEFMNPYNVLVNLSNMTNITDDETNTFLMMANNTTHEPMLLQEPEYEPAQSVDNTAYYNGDMDRFTIDGKTLKMEDYLQVTHYQTNMAAMIQLGKWFDYLKENDVYDNTRIIIVSDHGRPLYQMDELILQKDEETTTDIEFYMALLMVKDFDASGFTVSEEFMTNADVPTIAVDGVVENPINPFTGKEINNDEKYNGEQYVTRSMDYEVWSNNGTVFSASKWMAVKDNIWEPENWRWIDEEVSMPVGY